MFILLSERKRRREPTHFHGLPIVGFVDRKGRPTRFHKGRYQSPVILESDYLTFILSTLPARRVSRPPKKPQKARKAVQKARPALRGWLTTGQALQRLNGAYPDYDLGSRSGRFQGYVRQSSDLFNLTVWDKPAIPKKAVQVDGFNFFVMVKAKRNSPKSKDNNPYLLAGFVVAWRASVQHILNRLYESDKFGGPSIQKIMPHSVMIDSLAYQFFSLIGQPVELVGIQFRQKFSRLERSRTKHLQDWKKRKKYLKNPPKGNKKW